MTDITDNLVIRPARRDDVNRIRKIAAQAWDPIYQGYRQRMGDQLYERETPDDPLAVKAEAVANFYDEYPDWGLVTEIDGQVVGFITFVLNRDKGIGEIGNNAVEPGHQGRGIGTAQCQRVLEIFRQEGMRYAKVHTGLDPAHVPARAMYEKMGFEPIMPHVEYYRKL